MNARIKLFIYLNIALLIVWVIYLFSIQILDVYNLRETVQIRQNPSKEILIPERGNIYDRKGDLLVSCIKYYQLDVDRRAALDNIEPEDENSIFTLFDKISLIISEYSDTDRKLILSRLQQEPLYSSIFITNNITENQLHDIKQGFSNKKIKGLVETFHKIERSYPHDKLGVNFLGIMDDKFDGDNNNNVYRTCGKNGVEATFDDLLTGEIGWRETIYDAKNRNVPLLFLKKKPALPGNSIYLTIDTNVQEILEEKLIEGLSDYKAKNAIGIVMEPQSGEILAMAGIKDDYNYRSAKELRSVTNIAASFMFEPGSTLKPITALLALEKNIFDPKDKIDCSDYHIEYQSEERVIKDDHKYKTLSFKDIIAYSSNVGISRIVEKIGSKMLYERMIAMGFGHKTGSNISGESSGIFRKLKDWKGFSLHSISFGQEISVTALQLANAYCSLANGGNVMQPHLLKEVKDYNNNTIFNSKPKVLRSISTQNSLDTLKVFLKGVVDYGTATGAKVEGLTLAGKTGTSEKAITGKVGYEKEKYTSIFAGFFPVNEPEYVIVIVYDEPDYESYSYYASLSAVPTFQKIVKTMINLPETETIANVKENNKKFIFAPDVTGLQLDKAIEKLQKKGIDYVIYGNNAENIVTDQYPKPNISFDKTEKVILSLDNKQGREQLNVNVNEMPDLKGLTLRKAIALSNKCNIKLLITGKGVIIDQTIKPGSKTKFGDQCGVTAR
ncbi:MAG: PASTA domain-containing protein [Candidatus Cloacimonetes bacterium]|nr:PASTA domain-containing protein [Candidatus Cloacimonadota bacterium]